MIYWGDDSDLNSCKKCGHARYKEKVRGSGNRLYIRKLKVPYKKMHYFPITPRLQRLYASTATTNEMRWHSEHHMEDGKMCHPSDAPAWKHFDGCFPDFSSEVRNVRLGLFADGFQPFGQSR